MAPVCARRRNDALLRILVCMWCAGAPNLLLPPHLAQESWHNSHHAFPGSARHGLEWWQARPGWAPRGSLPSVAALEAPVNGSPAHATLQSKR